MGERLNGIQEVGSSILPGSTKQPLSAVPAMMTDLRTLVAAVGLEPTWAAPEAF